MPLLTERGSCSGAVVYKHGAPTELASLNHNAEGVAEFDPGLSRNAGSYPGYPGPGALNPENGWHGEQVTARLRGGPVPAGFFALPEGPGSAKAGHLDLVAGVPCNKPAITPGAGGPEP